MKTVLILFTLLSIAFAAPQARQKNFYDHIVDFVEVIAHEVGNDVDYEYIPMVHYLEYEEFQAGLNFINSKEFKEILREIRNLPEYHSIVEYLRNEKMEFSEFFGIENDSKSLARHHTSGKDMTSYIKEFIKLLPNKDIVALYKEKIEEYDDFRASMETFQSDEFKDLLRNLWSNEVTQKHLHTLAKYGLDLNEVLKYVLEYYGVK